MFGNWLNRVPKKDKNKIRIGISAICWTIWRTRNDIIFNIKKCTNFLLVIHPAVHWILLWAFLLPVDQCKDMDTGCTRLPVVTQYFFSGLLDGDTVIG
jgi:hypothetical protein